MHRDALAALFVAYAVGSVVSFVAFGIDKRRASRKERRIPEKTLHGLTLAFGVPGALFAMMLFRHKTRKTSFRVVTALIAVAHAALVGLALRYTLSAR